MKRFLSHAIMFCVLGAGVASAVETPAQPQTTSPATQATQQECPCPAQNLSAKEAKKQAKLARKREKEERKRARQEAEPQPSEDAVEMGGGG